MDYHDTEPLACIISEWISTICITCYFSMIPDAYFASNLTNMFITPEAMMIWYVVYGVECNLCGLVFVGETKWGLNTRMCGHRSGINNNQYHEVYHHFRQQDHSNLYTSFHLGNNFNLSTPLRRQKEEYWMCESWELQCHTSAMWKVWMSSTKAISYTINLLELWFHLFSKINMFLSFHIHMFPPLHPKS